MAMQACTPHRRIAPATHTPSVGQSWILAGPFAALRPLVVPRQVQLVNHSPARAHNRGLGAVAAASAARRPCSARQDGDNRCRCSGALQQVSTALAGLGIAWQLVGHRGAPPIDRWLLGLPPPPLAAACAACLPDATMPGCAQHGCALPAPSPARPVPEGFTVRSEGQASILQAGNETFFNPAQVVNRDMSLSGERGPAAAC